jgi:hypothetical protein
MRLEAWRGGNQVAQRGTVTQIFGQNDGSGCPYR